jgi:hypothetical protein
MKIVDNYFDEKIVPNIAVGLNPYLDEQMLNKIIALKLKDKNFFIKDKFHAIYQEIRKIFDFKIINNNSFTDLDEISQPFVEIYSFKLAKIEEIHDILEKNRHLKNESLIGNLKIFDYVFLFVKFSRFNSNYLLSNENVSQRILNMDRSYWKQTPVIQISTKYIEFSKKIYQFLLNKNYLKNLNFEQTALERNEEFYFSKKSFEFLGAPYKSRCNYYENQWNKFNSSSHDHCIRQCFRYYCQIKLNCSCLIFKVKKKFVEISTQLDMDSDKICSKNLDYMKNFYEIYTKLCVNLCPIDCLSEEFITTSRFGNTKIYSNQKDWKTTLFWDNSKPLIMNKETPVITLIDYFCCIGGLFGMWFGISANQLLGKLKENCIIYYRNFMQLSLILFYTSLEIIFIIKTKLLSIKRYFILSFRYYTNNI